jgi:hypothetical protein
MPLTVLKVDRFKIDRSRIGPVLSLVNYWSMNEVQRQGGMNFGVPTRDHA